MLLLEPKKFDIKKEMKHFLPQMKFMFRSKFEFLKANENLEVTVVGSLDAKTYCRQAFRFWGDSRQQTFVDMKIFRVFWVVEPESDKILAARIPLISIYSTSTPWNRSNHPKNSKSWILWLQIRNLRHFFTPTTPECYQ